MGGKAILPSGFHPVPHDAPQLMATPHSDRSSDAVSSSGQTLAHAPSGAHYRELPRVLRRFDAITVVIGSIIGSGIFLKPSTIADTLGAYGFGAIISVWIVVGLVTLCGSLALAELAAMLPHAGGPYVYLREAYGRMPAFLWGWTEFWVIRTGSLGALAVATVIYLNKALVLYDPERLRLSMAGQEMLAIAIVAGLSAINFVATRWGANLQNATVVVKVGFLVGVIALPFVTGGGSSENLLPLVPGSTDVSFWRAFGLAAIGVLWAYDGWINIGPVAEEIQEPQRNVPLALTAGLLTVIAVYVLANVAYHLTLSIDEVKANSEVAANVVQKLVGPAGGIIVALGVMCSTFGAVNSNMITGPRIYFAMARDGLLPKSICTVHARFQTPSNAILAQTVWTVALIVACYELGPALERFGVGAWFRARNYEMTFTTLSPDEAFDALTNFVIFGGSIFYAMAVAAVFVLRVRRPEWERPYRTWGYPFVPALYMVFFVAVMASMLIDAFETSMAGMSLIVVGVIYYLWARTRPAARGE
ncbi:MAG: amino acid transporter [Planctomycetota bacterium]|nr:MAG: amino acid transporter [Planctomycetota bacterium]